jgi:hypothetical protein
MKTLKWIAMIIAAIMVTAYIIPDTAVAETRTLTSAVFVTIRPTAAEGQVAMPQDVENTYMNNISGGPQKLFVKEEKLAQGGNGLYTMAQML